MNQKKALVNKGKYKMVINVTVLIFIGTAGCAMEWSQSEEEKKEAANELEFFDVENTRNIMGDIRLIYGIYNTSSCDVFTAKAILSCFSDSVVITGCEDGSCNTICNQCSGECKESPDEYCPNEGIFSNCSEPLITFDSSTDESIPIVPENSIIVTAGGPGSNRMVRYYENNKIAPACHVSKNSSLCWESPCGKGSCIPGTGVTTSMVGNSSDYFVVESFADNENEVSVLIVYGHTKFGTKAAGYFIKQNNCEIIKEIKSQWRIYKWEDLSGDKQPGPGDNFTLIASGLNQMEKGGI